MRSGESKPKLNPKKLSDEPHPLGTVSPLRFLTISWLTPLLRLGATKEQLSPDDVWHLRHRDRAAPLGARFDHAMQSSRGSRRVPRTLAALWRCFHRAYLLISLHWVVFVVSQLMAPRTDMLARAGSAAARAASTGRNEAQGVPGAPLARSSP